MQKTISKSTKPRQGVKYINDRGNLNKEFDRNARQWKEVVYLTENGKKVNGKTAYISRTRHEAV